MAALLTVILTVIVSPQHMINQGRYTMMNRYRISRIYRMTVITVNRNYGMFVEIYLRHNIIRMISWCLADCVLRRKNASSTPRDG